MVTVVVVTAVDPKPRRTNFDIHNAHPPRMLDESGYMVFKDVTNTLCTKVADNEQKLYEHSSIGTTFLIMKIRLYRICV